MRIRINKKWVSVVTDTGLRSCDGYYYRGHIVANVPLNADFKGYADVNDTTYAVYGINWHRLRFLGYGALGVGGVAVVMSFVYLMADPTTLPEWSQTFVRDAVEESLDTGVINNQKLKGRKISYNQYVALIDGALWPVATSTGGNVEAYIQVGDTKSDTFTIGSSAASSVPWTADTAGTTTGTLVCTVGDVVTEYPIVIEKIVDFDAPIIPAGELAQDTPETVPQDGQSYAKDDFAKYSVLTAEIDQETE